jgi:predicted Zn-dependent protease
LATIELKDADTNIVQKARQTLEICKTNELFRTEALRLIIWDYSRQNSYHEAAECAEMLLQEPKAIFDDKILRLDVLSKSSNSLVDPLIAALKSEAGTNIQRVFQLGEWLKSNRRAEEALAWIDALPPQSQTNMPVPLLLAECRSALNDYPTLIRHIEHEHWGKLEYWRHAIWAKSLQEVGNKLQSHTSWQTALALAKNQLEHLSQLLQFTAKEKWTNEYKEVLWVMALNHPKEEWAIQTLENTLFKEGDTRQLHKLYSHLVDVDPKNLRVKNNLAMTGILLDPHSTAAYSLARECYHQNPTNGFYLSTYAFALFVRNQTSNAVHLIEQINRKELENPAIAICYGIILGSTGDPKAKPYLDITGNETMLPEIVEHAKKVRSKLSSN